MSRKRRVAQARQPSPPLPSGSRVTIRPAVAKGDDAELLLYGEIGAEVTASSVREQLALMRDAKTITVRVNSVGGEVSDGIAIYTALRQHSARKVAVVEGIAASIASVILCACDEVIVSKGSFIMVHQCSGGATGSAQDMQDAAAYLTKINAEMVDIYSAKTGKPATEIAALLSKGDTYMTADEAVSFGIATSVAQASARYDLKAVAKLDQRKIPEPLRALLKEKSMDEDEAKALKAKLAKLEEENAALKAKLEEGDEDEEKKESDEPAHDEDEDTKAEEGDEDEEKKEEAKAVLKLVAQLTGKKGFAAMRGALVAKLSASAGDATESHKASVTEAIRAGKLAPAMKAWALSDPKGFAAYRKELGDKTIVPVGQRHSAPADVPKPGDKPSNGVAPTAAELTEAERVVMKALRRTPAQMIASRALNPLTSKEIA